jgi:hypothetical protein
MLLCISDLKCIVIVPVTGGDGAYFNLRIGRRVVTNVALLCTC